MGRHSVPSSRHERPRRRAPRWSELRPLLPERVEWRPVERRLERAHTIPGLRAAARRRTPRAVFDYVDGAAENEISMARARRAFTEVEFRPRVLRDVSGVDASTMLLGARAELPIVFAPTGFTRMLHHEGEVAVGRVAARLGIPYALSTLGTTSPEQLAAASPDTSRWFQLYVWRDRGAVMELVERAAASGFSALVLTVDAPVAGARLRDLENGLTVPPTLTLRTMADMARHPAWWLNLVTTDPLELASFTAWGGGLAETINRVFDPTLTVDDLAELRERWAGPLVVKGVQTVEDAHAVADLGADAIVVSNHGGRQLDRAPTPLELLPAVVEAVGEQVEVYADGGVLSGADVAAALAFGARACLVGRAYLYGLMAGGERGVERAGRILADELVRTMQLLGVRSVDELGPSHAWLRSSPDRAAPWARQEPGRAGSRRQH